MRMYSKDVDWIGLDSKNVEWIKKSGMESKNDWILKKWTGF